MAAASMSVPAPEPAKIQWQCQVGRGGSSWVDYGPEENQALEAAWRRQCWTVEELVITLPGWTSQVFYLGSRFQQINFETGRMRTMRRVQVMEEGRPGGWTTSLRSETEDESSPPEEIL